MEGLDASMKGAWLCVKLWSFRTVSQHSEAAQADVDLGSVLLFASGPKSAHKAGFTPRASNSLWFNGRFVVGAVAACWSAPRPGA